jgi:hypothetical protein
MHYHVAAGEELDVTLRDDAKLNRARLDFVRKSFDSDRLTRPIDLHRKWSCVTEVRLRKDYLVWKQASRSLMPAASSGRPPPRSPGTRMGDEALSGGQGLHAPPRRPPLDAMTTPKPLPPQNLPIERNESLYASNASPFVRESEHSPHSPLVQGALRSPRARPPMRRGLKPGESTGCQALAMQNPSNAGVCRPAGLDSCHTVRETGSGATQRGAREKLLEAAAARRSTWCWCGGWTAGAGR